MVAKSQTLTVSREILYSDINHILSPFLCPLCLSHPRRPLCLRVGGATGAAGGNPSYPQPQPLWPLWVSSQLKPLISRRSCWEGRVSRWSPCLLSIQAKDWLRSSRRRRLRWGSPVPPSSQLKWRRRNKNSMLKVSHVPPRLISSCCLWLMKHFVSSRRWSRLWDGHTSGRRVGSIGKCNGNVDITHQCGPEHSEDSFCFFSLVTKVRNLPFWESCVITAVTTWGRF